MLGQGALIAVVTLISFYIGLQTSPAVASTMAFATLTLARLFHGFIAEVRIQSLNSDFFQIRQA